MLQLANTAAYFALRSATIKKTDFVQYGEIRYENTIQFTQKRNLPASIPNKKKKRYAHRSEIKIILFHFETLHCLSNGTLSHVVKRAQER